MDMDSEKLKKLMSTADAAFNSSERKNFEELWDNAAKMCRPVGNTTLGPRTAGERKNTQRLIDTGIQSLNTFGAGITSTLIPKGSKFFTYQLSRRSKQGSNELTRWLNDCSGIANDFIMESNFFTEAPKAFEDLGLVGTSMMLVESDDETGVRFKSYYIDTFAFNEDAQGRTDQVFFKIDMTPRQLKIAFPDAELPQDIISKAELGNGDEKYKVYLIISPRLDYVKGSLNPKDFKYQSLYILHQDSVLLKESGYKSMPAPVCRWKQASNEQYGRSPAIEVQSTLSIMNSMEYTKLKSAQRIADPQWLVPNDGSVRNLNNQHGGVVFYNASNPNAMPKQLVDQSQPQITENYLQQKVEIIKDAFFVPIFNPLIDKQNMTLGEVAQRMAIANQNLVPNIARVIDELLQPAFKAVFQILLEGGFFPVAPPELEEKDINVVFVSKAAMAIKSLEAQAALQYSEIVGQLAQFEPAALDKINVDEVLKLQEQALSLPNEIVPSDMDVKRKRAARAEQMTAQAEVDTGSQMADAYTKTTKAPEEGSPGAALMDQMGIGAR